MSFEAGIPFVMPIHDLQHRLQPQFPEVSGNGEWNFREFLFRNSARHATLLLADSEVGKEDILECYGSYGITPDRIKVVPYLPAHYLATAVSEIERRRVRIKHDLPTRYLFYPAQFWLHKNHAGIVRALDLLKRRYGQGLPIVFCGSHTGDHRERTFRDIMALISQCGIEKDVRYLGYVPDEDMSGLYAEAEGLIMPTFFGPTNIPVLEAWAFGCPVLTSDIRGVREQTGDGALLVDPRSDQAIADGIWRLWTDKDFARGLAQRGRQRLASYTPMEYRRRMRAVLCEAKTRVAAQRCAPVSQLDGPDR
jgi:glycosyltransferase involved in cell wall biosynthesis